MLGIGRMKHFKLLKEIPTNIIPAVWILSVYMSLIQYYKMSGFYILQLEAETLLIFL